jgi:hypothetical protein
METTRSSETSVGFQRTTQRYTLEYRTLQTRHMSVYEDSIVIVHIKNTYQSEYK